VRPVLISRMAMGVNQAQNGKRFRALRVGGFAAMDKRSLIWLGFSISVILIAAGYFWAIHTPERVSSPWSEIVVPGPPGDPVDSQPPRPSADDGRVPGNVAEHAPRGQRPSDVNDFHDLEVQPPAPPSNDVVAILQKGRTLQGLPFGKIVLVAPAEMKVGDVRQVDANVGIDVPMETLRKALHPADQEFEGVARLSAKMSAQLIGSGFSIKALTPEQQTIASGFPTVWSWSIEAKDHGEQLLEATLYALLPDAQRLGSYTQKIDVSVRPQTWSDWFEAFGKQYTTAEAIVVSLFGLGTFAAGWFGISRRKQVAMAFRAKKTVSSEARSSASEQT
jgi:hypothetical protein